MLPSVTWKVAMLPVLSNWLPELEHLSISATCCQQQNCWQHVA